MRGIALSSFGLALAAAACTAPAAEFVVDRINDGGPGSLRAAIDAANAAAGADRIVFDVALAGATLSISAPAPTIAGEVEIVGPDGAPAMLQSTGADRVLAIVTSPNTIVSLRGLVLAGGRRPDADGGCLWIDRASVLLERIRLTDCQAKGGGAVAAESGALLEVQDSRIDHSRAQNNGGGILAFGPLFIGGSEIDHNAVDGVGYVNGGGVYANGSDTQTPVWILDSRLHHNTALSATPDDSSSGSAGGALFASSGKLLVQRSSFYANRARYAAAINRNGFVGEAISARIVNSTFSRNAGMAAIEVLTGSLALEHSTIADNHRYENLPWTAAALNAWAVAPLRVYDSVAAGNYAEGGGFDLSGGGAAVTVAFSLVGRSAPGAIDPTQPGSNLLGIDAGLAPLAWNGGPTPTMRPLPGSPLIDAGLDVDLPPTDQRGFARRAGTAIDIGAVEEDGDRLFADSFDGNPAD